MLISSMRSSLWDKLLNLFAITPLSTGLWGSLVSFQLGVLVTPIQIRTDPPYFSFNHLSVTRKNASPFLDV